MTRVSVDDESNLERGGAKSMADWMRCVGSDVVEIRREEVEAISLEELEDEAPFLVDGVLDDVDVVDLVNAVAIEGVSDEVNGGNGEGDVIEATNLNISFFLD
ncbi:hypothetical protein U1Q18_015587 [Sarracenia purpurea var. burkii]